MKEYQRLIKELRLLCAKMHDEEIDARQNAKNKSEFASHFEGVAVARMQSRIEIETLIEKFGANRASINEGESVEVNTFDGERLVLEGELVDKQK